MAAPVGFIGLGDMGGPMAVNLVEARLLAGRARHRPGQDRAAARARRRPWPTRPRRWRPRSTRTIVMVETTAQAEEVIAGERGIIQSAKAGHIVVCMSTIDPFAARRLGDRLGGARASPCSMRR